VLRRSTRKVYNRAADALRLCAQSLTRSKSALGAKYCRLKAKLGAPKAVVAMAHQLARLVYRMLRYGQSYVAKGIHQYELKFRLQRIKWLRGKLVHSISNSLPFRTFHHQFLERVLRRLIERGLLRFWKAVVEKSLLSGRRESSARSRSLPE
jgi:hypothetical protein